MGQIAWRIQCAEELRSTATQPTPAIAQHALSCTLAPVEGVRLLLLVGTSRRTARSGSTRFRRQHLLHHQQSNGSSRQIPSVALRMRRTQLLKQQSAGITCLRLAEMRTLISRTTAVSRKSWRNAKQSA